MKSDTLRGLERGLQVLEALDIPGGLPLRELHRTTGLPKPTLLRILATLEAHGYARRRIADGTWRRSARGSSRNAMHDLLLDVASDVLDQLCRRIMWPSDLAVYDNGAMTIVETTRRKTPYVINWTGVGYRIPMLQTGLGRVWIAYCSEEERKAIVADLVASDSPFDRAAKNAELVEALIAETRARGYGCREAGFTLRKAGEEKTDGFAVPVRTRDRVVACINVTWSVSAFDLPTAVSRYLSDLNSAAAEIGSEIDRRLAHGSRTGASIS